jgi:hypothetical protein
MMRCRIINPTFLVAVFLLAALPARAARVVLRIRAHNPADKPQTVNVRSYLPLDVGPDDIIDPAGLELRYDIR